LGKFFSKTVLDLIIISTRGSYGVKELRKEDVQIFDRSPWTCFRKVRSLLWGAGTHSEI